MTKSARPLAKNPSELSGERFSQRGRIAKGLVRFVVTPPPPKGPAAGPFAAQLALARVHSHLVAMVRTGQGYEVGALGWFELSPGRGLAGYGLSRALRILLDVLAGLSALQDTQSQSGTPFVHGELVPALLRVDGSGAARLVPLAPWHWSPPGTLAAPDRLGHLAPERLLGDAIDQRADVFSAGVLLWEALAGRRLFEADSVDEIIVRLMGGKVVLPELPPELAWATPLKAVAMCALSVDPEQRFANCAELGEAIAAVAGAHVATRAEVAGYFSGRDPHARAVASACPPSLPTHNSSLSALVSPVQLLAPVAEVSSERAPRETRAPVRRRGRLLWLSAALLSVFAALAVSGVARYNARYSEARGAAASSGELRSAAPVAPLPVAPSPSAPVSPSASVAAVPEAAAPVPDAQTAPLGRDKSSKPPKSTKPSKSTPRRLKAPAKPAVGRDNEAEQYGI